MKPCEVWLPGDPPRYLQCGKLTDQLATLGCVHEHIETDPNCGAHGRLVCTTCEAAGCMNCVMRVLKVTHA